MPVSGRRPVQLSVRAGRTCASAGGQPGCGCPVSVAMGAGRGRQRIFSELIAGKTAHYPRPNAKRSRRHCTWRLDMADHLSWRTVMNSIIYIVGLVVVVGAILAFVF